MITRFTDAIATSKIPVFDMASNYDEVSKLVEEKLKPEIGEYGLDLTKFLISSITLPPAVQEALDKRTSMGIIGDLNKYTQFQTANAIEASANNPGGGASEGMGLGMGFGMAQQMMGTMNQANQQANPQNQQQNQQQMPPPMPPAVKYFVAANGQQLGPFDMGTLKNMIAQNQVNRESLVWREGMAAWTAAGQVPDVAALFTAVPPPLPPPM